MKISLSKDSKKRVPFDKTHDMNTTASWGFMQPTLCDEIVGGSSLTFKANTFCRLSPLVAPTFGRAIVKHYAYFVPIRDVFMAYENMISGTIYNGGNTSYVPTSVCCTSLRQLTMTCISRGCTAEVYSISGQLYPDQQFTVTNRGVSWTDVMRTAFNNKYNLDSRQFTSASVAIDGADMILTFNYNNTTYIVAVQFGTQAKNFRKVLMGLGYQLNAESDVKDISILPLLAYYKAWFDLFDIKQRNNWQNTNAYALIQSIAYTGATDVTNGTVFPKYVSFLNDLTNCFYIDNPDYFTAHNDRMNYMMTNINMNVPVGSSSSGAVPTNANISATETMVQASTFQSSPIAQRLALTMLKYVNKNTAIGQRIASYFAAHGLGDVDDNKDLSFVGATSVNIDFDSVMSMADTYNNSTKEGDLLGSYAGKGIGQGSSDVFKFTANSTGFFIVMTTVVPRCGYVQGIAPFLQHRTRFEFFNPEFEAMFMQASSRKTVFGLSDVDINDDTHKAAFDSTFGFIPSYSEYKQKQNYAGGDFTRRGSRATLLPYILDRWFTVADVEYYRKDSEGRDMYWTTGFTPSVVSGAMRYIGNSEFNGNFNRIFNEYDRDALSNNDDPFLIHAIYDYKVYQPMLPLRDSFDTDAFDGDTMTIEKA